MPRVETLELQVTGMDCEGCERRIGNAVRRVQGVRDATADHGRGTVRVTLGAEHAGRAAIVERIESAGFTVTAGADETGSKE